MGEQSAARLQGDRYQHLYSWYELLQLLDDDSPYEFGYVEHPEAGAADDVTLHARPEAGVPSRFTQVKFHVDQRDAYTPESLVVVNAGVRSLLRKLFDSWQEIRSTGPLEVWLVSNWSAAPDLGRYISGRRNQLRDEFFTDGPRTPAGMARDVWKRELAASDEELSAFCRDLRLRFGFGAIGDLEEMVDDRMARFGMRYGANARAAAIDEVSAWVEEGGRRKRVTRATLLEAIERRHLWANDPDQPKVSLWIHGWARRAYDRAPSVELDWTAYFDRDSRRVASTAQWTSDLQPALVNARATFSALPGGSFIDFRGKLPLTTSMAIGAAFPAVGGYAFRTEQPTGGDIALWRSDASPSDLSFAVRQARGDGGGDLLVSLCVTGEAWDDVEAFYEEVPGRFGAVVYAEPEIGTGPRALRSDADAVALAGSAKELIRAQRRRFRARRVHLVLYGPASLALFLGQQLNAVGTVVGYERTPEGSYQPAVELHTG
jgi:hypothetical protein